LVSFSSCLRLLVSVGLADCGDAGSDGRPCLGEQGSGGEVGLFAVVGVSMRSSMSLLVWRGYAMALLGLNCFLLGVLTSPMLLGVARWLAATPPL
jgi:hypothetical protein